MTLEEMATGVHLAGGLVRKSRLTCPCLAVGGRLGLAGLGRWGQFLLCHPASLLREAAAGLAQPRLWPMGLVAPENWDGPHTTMS